MNSIIKQKTILFVVIMAIFISAESRDSFASAEWVYVEKVLSNDDNGIIVRANGEAYQIEKGTGCLSFWRYEGRRVLVSSPGMFLGAGSELILPDADQKCRIWDSKFLGQWDTSNSKSLSGKSHNAASKDEIKIIQIALMALGYSDVKADGIMGNITKRALKKFQNSNNLKASGTVDTNFVLALTKKINEKYPNDSDALTLSNALLNIAKRKIDGKNDTPSVNYTTGCDGGHWVSSISNGGKIVILENGSIWQVDSIDIIYTSLWLPTEEITICNEKTMVNTSNGEKTSVSRLK